MQEYKYFIRGEINECYPELISIFEEYINYIDLLGQTVNYNHSKDGIIPYFKISALNALTELFISSKKLLQFSHWRATNILIRTLFELLINIEYVFLKPEKSEELCMRFFKFGELQQSLHVKRDIQNNQYNIHNRINPKFFRMDDMLKEIENLFEEFIMKKKRDGTVIWYSYWNIKSPKDIVKELNNQERMKQFDKYYSELSDYVHGSPIFVASGVYHPEQIENNEIDEIENNHVFKQGYDLLLFSNEILKMIGNISHEFNENEINKFVQRIQELAEKNNMKGMGNIDCIKEKSNDIPIHNILPDIVVNKLFDFDFSKPNKEGNIEFVKKYKFNKKVSLEFKKYGEIVFHEVKEVLFKITPSGFIHCTIIGTEGLIGEVIKLPSKITIKEQILKFSHTEIIEYIVE